MASVLRAVADWIEAKDVQDPEFDHLTVKVTFEEDDDESHETATIYYREETP